MTGETVTYKGIPSSSSTCNDNVVAKSLELQQWILDPSSRPYETQEQKQKLIARSAGAQIDSKTEPSTIQKLLEVQRMVLGD